MSAFDDAFREVHGEEGDLSMDANDPGNWTGGAIGSGELKGTKYGISAAQYPTLDIANLTLEDAKAIMYRDYWVTIRGEELPANIATGLFDCAVNQGEEAAIKLLQRAVNVKDDGNFGPVTMAAFKAADPRFVAKNFAIARILRYSMTPGWSRYARSWLGRSLDTFLRMSE